MSLQDKYILCTDEDLIRGIQLFIMFRHQIGHVRNEIEAMRAELDRRAIARGRPIYT